MVVLVVAQIIQHQILVKRVVLIIFIPFKLQYFLLLLLLTFSISSPLFEL
jgi:hypothetical protein